MTCNDMHAFFTSHAAQNFSLWSYQKVCEALTFLLDNIYIYLDLALSYKDNLRRLFCFGSLVILDVARCYLWLFTLYINIKISKNSC